MWALGALACLLTACMAQRPQPCNSPTFMSGVITVSTQNEKLWTLGKFMYDGLGERVRFWEMGTYQNQSFTGDFLLHYKEGVVYHISERNRTCKKFPLKIDFQPAGVPKDATLMGQVVLGSSSAPGQGVLVNSWTGELPSKGGTYFITMTELGCIPVSSVVKTKEYGWVLTSYFDNIVGLTDPDKLNTPDFCLDAVTADVEPVHFFSLFQ